MPQWQSIVIQTIKIEFYMYNLQNENIVCLAGADWNTPLWTNRQHIMSRLSNKNRILYIESIGLRTPNFGSKSDLRKIFTRTRNVFTPLEKVNSNLYLLALPLIPYYKNGLINAFNKQLLVLYVKKVMRKLNFKRPVLWSYLPHAIWLMERIDFEYAIYHCVDEYARIPSVASGSINKMEEAFLKKCDITFVTSKKLYELKKEHNKNTFYLPNTADFAHFSKAREPSTVIPDDLSKIKRPVLGYIGNLCDHKVDFDLIGFIAKAMKEWSLVIIGPLWEKNVEANRKLKLLRQQKNIFLLGLRPYNMLPSYIKGFDVCIIPHKMTPYSQASFPLKTHEFFASGKPVVCTNLPSLQEYSELIYFASTPYDFVKQITRALLENDECKKRKRIHVASQNTWDLRIMSMEKLIDETLVTAK